MAGAFSLLRSGWRWPRGACYLFAAMGCLCMVNLAYAKDINLIGVFPGKAVISVNGGPPKTLGLDSGVWEGVRLLAVEGEQAVVDIDGKKHTLGLGTFRAAGGMGGGQRSSVTLQADGRGHFITEGKINGGSIRFMVDTGASMIAIGIGDARRLGINYSNGRRGYVNTANGATTAYYVKLDVVDIRGVTANNVDAVVLETLGGVALLGMSYLNRMEMQRSGESMTLSKRY